MLADYLSSDNPDKRQRQESILRKHVENINNPRVSEEETDLINLLDDFSISTQTGNEKETKIDDLQLQELQKFLSTTGTSNLQNCRPFTQEQEKEYQKFFEKYERKINPDTGANKIEIRNKEAGASALCNSYMGTPKVLVPKLDQEHNIEEPLEDLIDEVLQEKNLEKHLRNLITSNNFYGNVVINSDKSKFSNSCIDKNNRIEKSDIMDQIVSNNNINLTTLKVHDNDILTNNIFFTKKEIPKQHSNINIEQLVSKYNIKYLEAVKMDEKLFPKRSILKSEAEKIRLSPGPTLRDKAVVLPQIMKRLADTKKSLDEHTHFNSKLVLDTGSSVCKPVDKNALLGVNPNAKTFEFAENTECQYFQAIKIAPVTMGKSDKITSSFNITSNNKPTPETFGSGFKNSQVKVMAAKNDGIYRDSRFIHIDELKAIRREKILSEEVQDSIMVGPHVLRPPQPLIPDCNKDRFVYDATSKLFNDFVNGKY